jgi:hypothetical protein
MNGDEWRCMSFGVMTTISVMKIKNEGEGDGENVDADDARAYVDGNGYDDKV